MLVLWNDAAVKLCYVTYYKFCFFEITKTTLKCLSINYPWTSISTVLLYLQIIVQTCWTYVQTAKCPISAVYSLVIYSNTTPNPSHYANKSCYCAMPALANHSQHQIFNIPKSSPVLPRYITYKECMYNQSPDISKKVQGIQLFNFSAA